MGPWGEGGGKGSSVPKSVARSVVMFVAASPIPPGSTVLLG